jgi:hypothetical protein
MELQVNARLDWIDSHVAHVVLNNAENHIAKLLQMITAEPERLAQTRHSSLASDYLSIAWYSYALGHPIIQVYVAFSRAAHAYLKVFHLRGKEPAFPAFKFKYDPTHPPGSPDNIAECRPIHDEHQVDYSLTNSHTAYLAVCVALVARERAVGEELAALIWDPINASYVGPSSFCTSHDQRLAYALRELFNGDLDAMGLELDALQRQRARENIAFEAAMVRALGGNDVDSFLDELARLLEWHERMASSKQNRKNPEFYVCTRGLGLCALACDRQLLETADMPKDNVFLPLQLLSTSE